MEPASLDRQWPHGALRRLPYESRPVSPYRVKPGGFVLRDEVAVDMFTEFARVAEPRLRRSLSAGFGSEIGREAAAEALAYGWENWSRVEDMANPTGYLFRVGQNKARRLIPRSRRFSRDGVTYSEPWMEPGLEQAWSSLSERERVVAGLVHAFDWTLSEVADLLGVSKGTAQSYEKRAMLKLRRALGVAR